MTITTNTTEPIFDDASAQDLSERLADFFRTTETGDVFSVDVFLDGHPPRGGSSSSWGSIVRSALGGQDGSGPLAGQRCSLLSVEVSI